MLKVFTLKMLPGAGLTAKVGLLGAFVGWFLSWGDWQPAEGLNLGTVDIRPTWETAWVRDLVAQDPVTDAVVNNYVAGLSSAGYLTHEQGVWVATSRYATVQHEGNTLRPAASLTKVATTLAALETWGPKHRFETRVGWQGQLTEAGVIQGDLIIEGGDDPLFVWEEAIALANTLQKMGIRRVTGNLIVANRFNMNFETDVSQSGRWLKQSLNADEWSYEIEEAYLRMPSGTAKPRLQIDGTVQAYADSWENRASGWLIRHDSLPLVAVLKAMNIYSNNPMAEQIAQTVGGPAALVNIAQTKAGVTPGELVLVNGSGLGEANQMSAQTAVRLFQAIHNRLRVNSFTISDIFPISGADGGTLVDRSLPQNSVVKTGSLAVVSTLAGVLPTEQKGLVWFAMLNYGSGLDALRLRQDRMLIGLEQAWGKPTALPPELDTTVVIGQSPYRLGDESRNHALL